MTRYDARESSLLEYFTIEVDGDLLKTTCRQCGKVFRFSMRKDTTGHVAGKLADHHVKHREEDDPIEVLPD